MKPKTLLEFLDRTPPAAIYAAAMLAQRHGHNGHMARRQSPRELARRSGMPLRTFQSICYRPTILGMRIELLSQMAAGCGVDLLARRPLAKFKKLYAKYGLTLLKANQRKALDRAFAQKRKTPEATAHETNARELAKKTRAFQKAHGDQEW